MPSPFPGMNPYLERAGVWPEFHGAFLYRLRAQLVPVVEPRYDVRVGESVWYREMPDDTLHLFGEPDLQVAPDPAAGPPPAGTAPDSAPTTAPTVIELARPVTVRRRTRHLEIRTRDGEQLVTALELLSPSNKRPGADRDQYLEKRTGYLDAGVNFIELDFLRGGPRTWPNLPACDYYALVARAAERPRGAVYPLRLRDPLPLIPVPLRPGEPEPRLDLQAALHAAYDEAGYRRIIYRGDPEPDLPPADAAWAATLIPRPAA